MSTEQPHEINVTPESAPIREIDMTGRSLFDVHSTLTQLLEDTLPNPFNPERDSSQAIIFHGSSQTRLQTLEPRYTQFGSADPETGRAEHITAVFGTIHPHITMARAVAGERLQVWSDYILFGVDDLRAPFPAKACVYLVPRTEFAIDVNDSSEFHCAHPVAPATRVIFDSSVITPAFRTVDQCAALNMSIGDMVRRDLREIDIDLAVLALRNRVFSY